jgi:hypothetical protein
VVLVDETFSITVGGGLRVVGEPNKPVVFTATAETRGKEGHWAFLRLWGATRLENVQVRRCEGVRVSGGGVQLKNVTVYAALGDAALSFGRSYSEPVKRPEGLTIFDATGTGVVFRTACHVKGLLISGCATGVEIGDLNHPTLDDVTVHEAKGEGLQIARGSYPTFANLTVLECPTGVSVLGGSYPRLARVTVLGGNQGMVVGEESRPRLRELLLVGCREHGLRVAGRSRPEIRDVHLEDIKGVGMCVTGNSSPALGDYTANNCKQEETLEPGSHFRIYLGRDDR